MTQPVENKYKMELDLNVLNHLGLNLYSNIPSVLSEAVANAWDADATIVKILIEEDGIIIEDNGHGMDLGDLNNRFLKVGYARRKEGRVKTPILERDVMGRKGIGKLSLFSIAESIEVHTKKGTDTNAFKMTISDIALAIEANPPKPYYPIDTKYNGDFEESGTKIILKGLKKKVHQTSNALVRRLARRFSILNENFQIFVNEKEVTIQDRDYFHKLEYIMYYGKESEKYANYAQNVVKKEERANVIEEKELITGWIGLVKESGSLQVEDDDNLNKISLMVRGKMAQEDLLEEFREGGLYTKYLIGEITADFLDLNDKPDISTSSRQSIIEDDERYIQLKKFLQSELRFVATERAKYKEVQGEKEALQIVPIKAWFSELKKDERAKATKLFAKVNQVAVDDKHKKTLFAYSVIAFESLRYKDALDAIENVTLDNLEPFLAIFKEFDDIEATLYYKITKERLQVIEKLKDLVHNENALEKILQEYLYKYLWLLDPAWDRATETVYMEEQARTAFNNVDANLSPDESKGRIDIRYKKTSGKHLIIELKRASVDTSKYKLEEQVDKYRSALLKLLRLTNPHENPSIESICVVGKLLTDWKDPESTQESIRSLATKNIRVITYEQLINDSYTAYKEYLDTNQQRGRIQSIVHDIEKELLS